MSKWSVSWAAVILMLGLSAARLMGQTVDDPHAGFQVSAHPTTPEAYLLS